MREPCFPTPPTTHPAQLPLPGSADGDCTPLGCANTDNEDCGDEALRAWLTRFIKEQHEATRQHIDNALQHMMEAQGSLIRQHGSVNSVSTGDCTSTVVLGQSKTRDLSSPSSGSVPVWRHVSDASGSQFFDQVKSSKPKISKLSALDKIEHIRSKVNKREMLLDIVVAVVIIFNTIVLFAETQWRGWHAAVQLGRTENDDSWAGAETVFLVIDHIINVFYLFEICMRMALHKRAFFRDPMHMFDVVIVLATSTDLYILQPLDHGNGNLAVARLVRLFRMARIVRLARVLRFAVYLSHLRVMIGVLLSCARPLFYSMLIVGVLVLGSSIFVAQSIEAFILGDADLNLRLWVFDHYGTAAKASYTIFEVTFSGSWPGLTRPLVEHVSAAFSIFWVMYQIAVSFAVLRIIGAVFLNETIKAQEADAEMMILNKLKEKEKFAEKLRQVFVAADTSGDGRLSFEELQEMFEDPNVLMWLDVLELDQHEVWALFRLLDGDNDGSVSYEEFLGGAVRMKGHARAVDSILIMQNQDKMKDMLKTMNKKMSRLAKDWNKEQAYAQPLQESMALLRAAADTS